jgi:hypothetical protein
LPWLRYAVAAVAVGRCEAKGTAVELAGNNPLARTATVEVRPFWDAPWDH